MSNKVENKIMVVRLSTGELLMGRMTISPNNELSAVMKNAVSLIEMAPSNKGDTGNLAMMPFMPFTNGGTELEIFFAAMSYMTEPVEQISKKYEEQFSSIIRPDSMSIGDVAGSPILGAK